MNFNINSPSYYTEKHGIVNEVYEFCRQFSMFFKNKNYSEVIDTIGIIPTIAPREEEIVDYLKNKIKYELKYRFIYVKKSIDYIEYLNSNEKGKIKLMFSNILQSVESVSKKGKLNYAEFEKDAIKFYEDYMHNYDN